MQPRILDLGRLVLKGGHAKFHAAPQLAFEGKPGDVAELALRYAYEEADGRQEHARACLEVTLPGQQPQPAEVNIKDRAGRDDSVQGTLLCRVAFPAQGELRGAFQIDAYYTRAAWVAGRNDILGEFREKGNFVLRSKA